MASATTTTTLPPADTHESPTPRRFLLVSVPRTASNLLVKILNIHHQPNVLTSEQAGYFFYHGYMTAVNELDLTKPIDQWTDAEKTKLRDAYQQCLDHLEEFSARARRDNKLMFAKEHAFWLVHPATLKGPGPGPQDNPTPPSSCPRPADLHLTLPELYSSQNGDTTTTATTGAFSPTNPTWFPDAYLRTWQLGFVIRHPALAWPSLYRAMQRLNDIGMIDQDGVRGASVANMSLGWTRALFDWAAQGRKEGEGYPLVIDAHDVIHNPGVVRRFCEAAGMDPEVMQFEWDVVEKGDGRKPEGGHSADLNMKGARIMLATLEASKGVVKDKAPATVDIKAEAEKWKVEFGEEVAGMIEKMVWDAMPDYEYLRERRVQA